MKKILSYSLILFTVLAVSSCGELAKKAAKAAMGQTSGESVEFNVLTQPQELKKWYDKIAEKLGESSSVMDEISLNVNKLQDNKGDLLINLVYQSKEDKHNVVQLLYSSESIGWQVPITKGIDVVIGDAEDFKLEDELFDMKEIPYANLQKIVNAALEKYKDEAKYEYQYVEEITIKKNRVDVTISGKLKSNGLDKEKYYYTDFDGKENR
ncbi:hypothetical protein [Prevotella sp. OH937_COT-195]|uniref:hypothetical protein n=1 Tax=Prevotella sp. OH937_COT-195 TaxID=2491051 RepID=UPI000F64D7C9|nr:hypothetical protein [Prevotella sp. OH937_COT-195]RRD01944.1 hypothetical protein EII32_05180 [Prevotella sp. OH937_COT-195]